MGFGKQAAPLEAGASAPAFELRNLAGGSTSLAQLLPAGPVLLAFFKVSCPVCQFTLPFLERIHRGAAPSSLSIYGISQDETDATREFGKRYGLTYPILLDTARNHYEASDAYRITHVPTLFLIEPDGRISRVVEGFARRDIEELARQAIVERIFQPGEYVPEWKAG